jgi:hypothetical protein
VCFCQVMRGIFFIKINKYTNMKMKPYLASELNLWGTTKLRKGDTGSKLNKCVNDCYIQSKINKTA